MSDLNTQIPLQIKTLEDVYEEHLEKLRAYKVRNKYYYNHYKRTQDVRRQLQTNKKIADFLGVRYGVQTKAVGASS